MELSEDGQPLLPWGSGHSTANEIGVPGSQCGKCPVTIAEAKSSGVDNQTIKETLQPLVVSTVSNFQG